MWRAKGLADIARHVIGCHSTQETRVIICFDNVASIVCQALVLGVHQPGGRAAEPVPVAAGGVGAARPGAQELHRHGAQEGKA